MKLNFVIAGIILIALAIGTGLYFRSAKVVNYPRQGSAIIAFGDSLVTGYGLTTVGDDFVSLLSKRTGRVITNAGLNGDTTASALVRLEKDVLSQDPRVVTVLLGGNDALRQIPVEETFTNLEKIITRIHAKGAAVILVGVRGGIFGDKYRNNFKMLTKNYKVNFVPNILENIFANPKLLSDPIHPNEEGHMLIADRIEPILRKLVSVGE